MSNAKGAVIDKDQCPHTYQGLEGWLFAAPAEPWATLLLAHGAGAGMDSEFLEQLVAQLLGEGLAFDRVAAFVNHWLGALILWAVIALPLWHALHRVYHGLHDLKVGARPLFFVLCYGGALLLTLYSGYLLLLA